MNTANSPLQQWPRVLYTGSRSNKRHWVAERVKKMACIVNWPSKSSFYGEMWGRIFFEKKYWWAVLSGIKMYTRRPVSADRTARHQFQATGQPVSRTQANDAMTSRLPRYEGSECNTGASNAGWSLSIQTSREWSYPLQIYWYLSKGNWLRYNFAADSFYIMKLCSRPFVLYCRNCPKDDKFRYFIPILRKLGWCRTLVDGSLESPCRVLVTCIWTSLSVSCGWGTTRQNVSKLAAFRRG